MASAGRRGTGCNRPDAPGVSPTTDGDHDGGDRVDEQEFDALYDASFRRLTAQLYALIGDLDEAQDCVQEAFVRAWSHRRALQRSQHPEAWVRRTAYRLAVSRWRRATRARRAPDRAVAPKATAPGPDETHVAVVTALGRLPEDQRLALVLHHLADLPVAEVAREVGAPEGTVKARLSRDRAALASLLDEGTHHA
jgi:RNA polymerase sigma-70 factor (ECF subfamily)